jgi:hypothetical protein
LMMSCAIAVTMSDTIVLRMMVLSIYSISYFFTIVVFNPSDANGAHNPLGCALFSRESE